MLFPFPGGELVEQADDRVQLGDGRIVMGLPRALLGLDGEPVLPEQRRDQQRFAIRSTSVISARGMRQGRNGIFSDAK